MQGFVKAQEPHGCTQSRAGLARFLFGSAFRNANLRQGKEPFHESSGFWVQGCVSPGMLFKLQNKFFVCTGKTPAVLSVAQINYDWSTI